MQSRIPSVRGDESTTSTCLAKPVWFWHVSRNANTVILSVFSLPAILGGVPHLHPAAKSAKKGSPYFFSLRMAYINPQHVLKQREKQAL
jgi:hypothetical protein